MTVSQTYRTREITSPSARRETAYVARVAFHVLLWSAFVISVQVQAAKGGLDGAGQASPFERRFQDLDSADQRLFRAIQEGIHEAEVTRSARREWPSVEALAQQGIPPFAPDPIDRARYTWASPRSGNLINYIGTPAPESGRESFVVIIIEPEPGVPVDPKQQVDEVHHRLGDGTMIHVTVWMGPGLRQNREPVAFVAPDQGWRQVMVGPSPAPAK